MTSGGGPVSHGSTGRSMSLPSALGRAPARGGRWPGASFRWAFRPASGPRTTAPAKEAVGSRKAPPPAFDHPVVQGARSSGAHFAPRFRGRCRGRRASAATRLRRPLLARVARSSAVPLHRPPVGPASPPCRILRGGRSTAVGASPSLLPAVAASPAVAAWPVGPLRPRGRFAPAPPGRVDARQVMVARGALSAAGLGQGRYGPAGAPFPPGSAQIPHVMAVIANSHSVPSKSS